MNDFIYLCTLSSFIHFLMLDMVVCKKVLIFYSSSACQDAKIFVGGTLCIFLQP